MSTNGADPHGPDRCVRVRGARENNLRDVDVAIPRNALAVFTGVSGSGKSSLAFGTIYAEAQRRYFESVAPYARRLLQQTGAPKVDDIEGLPPAVALQQRRGGTSSRSSVGTVTTLSNSCACCSRAPAATRRGDRGHGLGLVLAEHGDRRVPGVPRAREDPPRHRGRRSCPTRRSASASARSPLGRARGRARTCATSSSRSATTSTSRGAVCRSATATGSSSPTSSPRCSSTPTSTRPTPTTPTTARSRAPSGTSCTRSPTRRAPRCASARCGSSRPSPCPVCGGTGLRPEALAVTFAGRTIAELVRLPLTELAEVLRPTAELEDPGAAYLSPESGEATEVAVMIAARPVRADRGARRAGARLPEPRPDDDDAVAGRAAAPAARDPAALRAVRRRLRARRAVGRPAPRGRRAAA